MNSEDIPLTRKCTKCGAVKPIVDFVFEKRSGNYLNYCVECNKKYHREYYEQRKANNANKVVEIDPNGTKRCIKCGIEKPLAEFSIDKANGKLINTCKACKCLITKANYEKNKEKRQAYAKTYALENQEKVRAYRKEYYDDHAEQARAYSRQYNRDHQDDIKVKRKAYRQAHKDEFRERDKRYAETHKEQITMRRREWAKANAERLAERNKQYRMENAEAIREKRRIKDKENRPRINAYIKNKRATDPLFKLSTQARNLVRASLKRRGYSKSTRTYEILGCSYEVLWAHLQRSWLRNYGTEWSGEPYHIDHIIPLATAKTEQEVIKLCYYKNLQLLKPRDNLVKNKY